MYSYFSIRQSARERIEKWIEEYELCLRYCHLTSDEAICFNHQINKCNGICAEEEEIVEYNKRAQALLDEMVFKDLNFALIDQGKTMDERSLIVVENGHYIGHGYIDRGDIFTCMEDCKGFISKSMYYPDSDDLIRAYLKNNRLKTIVFKKESTQHEFEL